MVSERLTCENCNHNRSVLEAQLLLPQKTTDTIPQARVHNSTARCKKDPLNLAHLFSNPQTSSTSWEALNSIPVDLQEGREPTKMDLDNDPGLMEPQSTRMDLDNVVQSLQFCLQSEMRNLAAKIHPSNSAISANTATQLDIAHSK